VLCAFIEDNPNNLDVPGEMDKFLAGSTQCAALRLTCRDDRQSGELVLEQKYTQGQIVTTLMTHLQSRNLSDGVTLPPKPTLLPPSRGLSSKPSSFGRQRPVSVNSVHVGFADGLSFDIPPDAEADVQYIAHQYTAAIHSVQADPRKFSSSSECVVCHVTGHSFDNCTVLNDIDFLKKHHIAYCVIQQRLQKMMITRLLSIAFILSLTIRTVPTRMLLPLLRIFVMANNQFDLFQPFYRSPGYHFSCPASCPYGSDR